MSYVRRLVERILNFAEFFMLILLVTEHITLYIDKISCINDEGYY